MAALLRSTVRRAAPAFRFSGHPAATGAAMRRMMHFGGRRHTSYGSPVFFGGGRWETTDYYFASFATVVMLACRYHVTEQADRRWSRKQNRREHQERMWARFQSGGSASGGEGGEGVDVANNNKL